MSPTGTPTIDSALTEFLADQRERLSARTFGNYEDVVSLLRSSLDNYGPNSLDPDERRRWERAFESDDEGHSHCGSRSGLRGADATWCIVVS